MLSSLNKWQKLQVFFIFLFMGGMFVFLSFKPSVTGHVTAEYALEDLEVVVLKNQTYSLVSNTEKPIELKSVLISGKIIGNGEVNIFLINENNRYLVYTNKADDSPLVQITGFAVNKADDKVEEDNVDIIFRQKGKEDILPDFEKELKDINKGEFEAFASLLESEIEENKKERIIDFVQNANGTQFKGVCRDTCALFGMKSRSYDFELDVAEGTILYIDEIIYSIEKE